MKRKLFLLLALICVTITSVHAAETSVVENITLENITYLPLRETCEQLGFQVSWDTETSTASVINDKTKKSYSVLNDSNATLLWNDETTYVSLNIFIEDFGIYYAQTDIDTYTFMLLDDADPDCMIETITFISEEPRVFGSKEIIKTKNYIADTFTEYGYETSLQDFSHDVLDWDISEIVSRSGSNIIAKKKPKSLNKTNDILIVGAHYDSVTRAPGANDNGSGVSAILEIAKLIKDLPSDTEIWFIAFDGEEDGLVGSYYFVDSMTDDEISRTIGMINFDMFASTDIDGMMMATTYGDSNYLTDMFDNFELHSEMGSDHSSFISLAIPSMYIGHTRDSFYHSPEDIVSNVDPNKLYYAASKGTQVISTIMSDITPSYQKDLSNSQTESNPSKINMTEPILIGADKEYVEKHYNLKTTQMPIKSTRPFELISAHEAFVDWWGVPLKTQFIYEYGFLDHMIIDISEYPSTEVFLNNELSEVDKTSKTSIYLGNTIFSEDSKTWNNNYGTAFTIDKKDDKELLFVTTFRSEKFFEMKKGNVKELIGKEQEAWNIVKKLLDQSGILNDISNLCITEDGYGITSLKLQSYFDMELNKETTNIYIDPNDILDDEGELKNRDDLLYTFAKSYGSMVFSKESQMNISQHENTIVYEGYKDDSYYVLYCKQFNTSYDDNPLDNYELMMEMPDTFAAFATGDNRMNIEQEKIEFFKQFKEFDMIRRIN